jgi:hypothetical protein
MFVFHLPLKHTCKNLSNFCLKPANAINPVKLDSDPSPGELTSLRTRHWNLSNVRNHTQHSRCCLDLCPNVLQATVEGFCGRPMPQPTPGSAPRPRASPLHFARVVLRRAGARASGQGVRRGRDERGEDAQAHKVQGDDALATSGGRAGKEWTQR